MVRALQHSALLEFVIRSKDTENSMYEATLDCQAYFGGSFDENQV